MGLLDSSELAKAVTRPEQRKGNEDGDVIERFRSDEALEVPIEMTDLDVWANYLNDDLYVLDKKMREFFKKTAYARFSKGEYRTTASVVFAWIYGHTPTPADGAACRMVHKLLKYYCTSWTGRTTYKGKPVERVYRFSKYSTNQKRAFSLRLRLEEADGSKGHNREYTFKGGVEKDKRTHGRVPRPDNRKNS